MKGDHMFRKKPKGSTNGGYARPRVQIGFDKEIIRAVTARAKLNDRSFAAEIRDLVALALTNGHRKSPSVTIRDDRAICPIGPMSLYKVHRQGQSCPVMEDHMDHVLGYYVFDSSRGWLQDDEKTWKFDFHGGAEFSSAQLANDIGERETGPKDTFYVMACLGSM